MHDANSLTLSCLQSHGQNVLAIIDENSYQLPALSCDVLTNRFDIAQKHTSAVFSDFDFSALNVPKNWVFRISKEKAINQHIIDQAQVHGATLELIGFKNEGFNSLIKPLKTQGLVALERHKNQLFCATISPSPSPEKTAQSNYHTLQWQDIAPGFYSKPGLFGWNKIDKASQWLMEELAQSLDVTNIASCLDLGAGYGYLSIRAKLMGINSIDATDNCAAALIACEANFAHYGVIGNVIASNIGQSINKKYDLILCNPPFHQGFAHNKQLIDDFCRQAASMLAVHGKAYFVVNQFVALEKSANKYFTNCEILATKEGFKIAHLQ